MVFLTVMTCFISCNKGSDFIDESATFPLGWKMTDSIPLLAYNVDDTLGRIVNTGSAPLGTEINSSFGKLTCGFYSSFQTTLTSTSFSFTRVDSAFLILPYSQLLPTYGYPTTLDVNVYEVTEDISKDINSKKNDYTYNSTLVGQLTNGVIKSSDSLSDFEGKSIPGLKVPLTSALINKLLAPGSYADDIAFQTIFKGLYVTSSSRDQNGMALIQTSSGMKIKIYGRNASNDTISSEFNTGNNTGTVNQYQFDPASIAANAVVAADKIGGDATIYSQGLYGSYGELIIPDLKSFAQNKSIFKAELTMYIIDTGMNLNPGIGILHYDSFTKAETRVEDEGRSFKYIVVNKDTVIGGQFVKKVTYNIGLHLSQILTGKYKGGTFRLYSYPILSNGSKFVNFIPSQSGIVGSKGMQPLAPKLSLYYVEK